MRPWGYWLYAAGQVGVIALGRYFFQWIIRFAHGDEAGALLSAATLALVLPVFRLFDAIVDPFIGVASDRWVRRGHERRSLLWWALPAGPLGLWLVFWPDPSMSMGVRWLAATLGMLLLFGGYSLYTIPFWSLVSDYSRGDAEVRTRLSNVNGMGVLVAVGAGFALSPSLVERLGFSTGALVFAGLAALLMALPYFAAPPQAVITTPPSSEATDESAWAGLRTAVRDRHFRAVIALFVGVQTSLTLMTSAAPFISERLLGGTLEDVALLLGPFLGSTLLFLLFVRGWVRRWGWERVALGGAVALVGTYLLTALLGRAVIGSPLTTAMIVFGSAGPGMAAMLGLETEAVTRSAERMAPSATGSYFGAFNFCIQATSGLALALASVLGELSRESVWAVRAMPIGAGLFCSAGVLGYVLLKRGA
ncbi:MAG TPA: MFS transporter [Polyangiaceae bacterium]|nr:MFS transporter [Polyangiaceae bacterium]